MGSDLQDIFQYPGVPVPTGPHSSASALETPIKDIPNIVTITTKNTFFMCALLLIKFEMNPTQNTKSSIGRNYPC